MQYFSKNLVIKLGIFTAIILGISSINSNALASVSSIMIDAETGKIISQYNADERRYPASLTKIMTLYLAFEAIENGKLSMNDSLKVSRKAANREPSRLGLRAGQTVKVKTAINALIVKSANDCATVLAEGLAGSEEEFAKKMTAKAKKLGMKNTTFKNASGLPNSKQKTTARDMATLATAMYNDFPQYYSLFSQRQYTYNGHTMRSHNHVLRKFKGADGMKTGYTRAAGFNIVTSAKRDGNRVIAVTMGHKTLKSRDTKVMSMMENGLTKLAQKDLDDTAKMYAQLNPITHHITNEAINSSNNDSSEKTWGIQIGAFSNYAKARNYALKIKKEIRQAFKGKNISVEPVAAGSAIVYRSKIIGFAKNDADSACKKLKSKNQSCIVVASNPSPNYASAYGY